MLRPLCYIASSLLLAGAGAYLIFGRDKGLGIFFVLIAAVVARVLVLNLAEGRFAPSRDEEDAGA